MKNIMFAAAALVAFSTPAMADDFTGPRVTGSVGYQDITNIPANRGFAYGVEVGYDYKFIGPVTIGVEAGLDNVFDRTQVNVGGRLGYELNEHTLVYGGVGYENLRALEAHNLDGLRLTAGLDVNVVGPVSIGAQYQHVDFGGTKKNGVAGTVTVRF
jgi:opacity protein-like surface antigen